MSRHLRSKFVNFVSGFYLSYCCIGLGMGIAVVDCSFLRCYCMEQVM